MNKYFIQDARKVDELPLSSKVDVIITSPPYFDMKDYGSKNQIGFGQTYEKYLNDLELVFKKCRDITKDTGSLWIVVDVLRKDGELKLLPFDTVHRVQKSGWKLRDIIIWEKDKTVPFSHNGEMRNIFEYVLFFSKTDNYKFYRERITSINDLKEWWQRYPERYSPNGKSPTNIWEFSIPLQGSWGKKYIKHFCPLPEKLIERMIHLTSDIDDVILDPFAGSGAVLSAAYRLKRNYIGSDLNSSYRDMFLNYVKNIRPVDIATTYKNDQFSTFSKTITKLRLLKLPKKMITEFQKKYPKLGHNIASIVVLPQKEKDKLPKNKYTACTCIFVTRGETQISKDQLEVIANNPPLSKYGVVVDVLIQTPNEAIKYLKKKSKLTGFSKYDNGITYKPGAPVRKLDESHLTETSKNSFPLIFSTLHLKENELSLEV